LEGLRFVKKLFEEHPFPVAMERVTALEAVFEAIIKDPKPTGIPGE